MTQVAKKQKIQIVFLQETGITTAGIPAATNLCSRFNWQSVWIPAKSTCEGGRGGLGILVREPLALTQVRAQVDSWGQLLVCELLDMSFLFR